MAVKQMNCLTRDTVDLLRHRTGQNLMFIENGMDIALLRT